MLIIRFGCILKDLSRKTRFLTYDFRSKYFFIEKKQLLSKQNIILLCKKYSERSVKFTKDYLNSYGFFIKSYHKLIYTRFLDHISYSTKNIKVFDTNIVFTTKNNRISSVEGTNVNQLFSTGFPVIMLSHVQTFFKIFLNFISVRIFNLIFLVVIDPIYLDKL